jgi:hypothetical protein
MASPGRQHTDVVRLASVQVGVGLRQRGRVVDAVADHRHDATSATSATPNAGVQLVGGGAGPELKMFTERRAPPSETMSVFGGRSNGPPL